MVIGLIQLTLPYTGLAAAKTLQRAFSRAWMPAFAIVTRPCSITSWMAVRSMSDILSNSSMQTTPRSARTMAPASRRRSPRNRRGKCTCHGLRQRTEKNLGLFLRSSQGTRTQQGFNGRITRKREVPFLSSTLQSCCALPHRSL